MLVQNAGDEIEAIEGTRKRDSPKEHELSIVGKMKKKAMKAKRSGEILFLVNEEMRNHWGRQW